MTTSWTTRTIPTSSWSNGRLGGSYLTNSIGEYILTSNSERIIVIVPGGTLPISTWGIRTQPTTSWTTRPTI